MIRRPTPAIEHGPRRGFTLTELLVVILIVLLVSAVTLPTVIPALTSRQVGESARILQATLAGARDAAIRHNEPRGIRLLPDKLLSGGSQSATGMLAGGQALTAGRIIPIEPAPDLTDSSINGSATFHTANATWIRGGAASPPPPFPYPINATGNKGSYPIPNLLTTTPRNQVLMIVQSVYQQNGANVAAGGTPILNPPTNWFWNVRIGDKIRFNDSGHWYTIVGPMTQLNPDGFVNDGPADVSPYNAANPPSLVETYGPVPGSNPAQFIATTPEFLFLVNGVDDDGDGFVDDGVNGIDEALTMVNPQTGAVVNPPYPQGVAVVPAADSIMPTPAQQQAASSGLPVTYTGEWSETETWQGSQGTSAAVVETSTTGFSKWFGWTIRRRPVPSPGARETSFPAGVVVDLTTWDSSRERSRLPVDPFSGNVDILLDQSGAVVPTTTYSNPGSFQMGNAFYHFWVADRRDVFAPTGTSYPSLPIGSDASGALTKGQSLATPPYLKYERALLTLFARTGHVVTNSLEIFNINDANAPYDAAQLGIREAK